MNYKIFNIQLVLILIAVSSGQSQTPTPTPTPRIVNRVFNPETNKGYAVVIDSMTWENAQNYAEQLGGHLVTIESEEEQNFLTYQVFDRGASNSYWIGLRSSTESPDYNWDWVTGESLGEYKNWKFGNPDGPGNIGLCVRLVQGNKQPLAWSRGECSAKAPFIIEFDMPPPIDLPEGYDWIYNPDNRHYYTHGGIHFYNEAKQLALSIGAYLATVDNDDELNFIRSHYGDGEWLGNYFGALLRDGKLSTDADQLRGSIFEFGNSNTTLPTPTPTIQPTQVILPDGYDWHQNPDNRNWYALIQEGKNWEEANIFAESLGGHLVTITSEFEQKFVEDNFFELSGKDIWIGLFLQNGQWNWVTNETFEYENWGTTFNGGGGEAFGEIEIIAPTWNDIRGSVINFLIVEIESTPLPPTPTSIPTSIPTPTPTPPNLNLLQNDTVEENNIIPGQVTGFREGKVSVVDLPDSPSDDGKGLEVTLSPGQGVWLSSNEVASVSSLAQISTVIKASDKNVAFALVALNNPIDGQIAYTNISGDEVPINDYRTLNLLYDPPSDGLQVALQVVNSPFASISSKVWIDSFRVDDVEPVVTGEPVELLVDGSFENGLEELVTNINDADGTITPFFETITDIAIRLEIGSDNSAANIGTSLINIEDQYPMLVLGEVNVKRELSMGDGVFAFVMTNGFQNIGLFRFINEIPLANDESSETIILGGDFNTANPSTPIMIIMQNGGIETASSIIVDDLRVMRK